MFISLSVTLDSVEKMVEGTVMVNDENNTIVAVSNIGENNTTDNTDKDSKYKSRLFLILIFLFTRIIKNIFGELFIQA